MHLPKITFDPTKYHYAFGVYDRVTIEGAPYKPAPDGRNEEGWVMMLDDGSGLSRSFTHAELSRLGQGRIHVERNFYAPETARRRLATGGVLISELPEKSAARVSKRSAYIEAFLDLERRGAIKRTDLAIEANMPLLRSEAMSVVSKLIGGAGVQNSLDLNMAPSPRTLRRWLKEYEANGMAGLVDAMNRRGNTSRLMGSEELALMMREVQRYASEDRPLMKTIHGNVTSAFDARNRERATQGRYPFRIPSYETVRRAIHSLDPYAVILGRFGVEAARKAFAPVAEGLKLTRPLERVEIDENLIDIVSLMKAAGILDLLTEQERSNLGLDNAKKRWILTVAICATTRCIVGLVFSRTAKEEASLKVLQMIFADKGKWADACGALGSWDMHGTPVLIVTDNGSAFRSERFRTACADAGIVVMRAPAGMPELRARNERFFHTLNKSLLPRLPGRTFGSIREKDDADPGAGAALTFDDLAFCLVRWIVDVYHNAPHKGLGGETPLDCWRRLNAKWGVQPPPDLRHRRAIFGERLTRTLSKEGITVMGVRYHSERLALCMTRKEGREVEVRWHPDDLGAVMARIDRDGEWFEVPSVETAFDGVTAQEWLAARRELQAADPERKAFEQDVIRKAIMAIERRSTDARTLAGLLVNEWSEERIRQEEARLFIGFRVVANRQAVRAADGLGRSIPEPLPETNAPTSTDATAARSSSLMPGKADEVPTAPVWRITE